MMIIVMFIILLLLYCYLWFGLLSACLWFDPVLMCGCVCVQASLSSSSKDPNTKSHKDDGLFKAPTPPPKVIKSVTIPTQPYQDIVTALKCRKEHKEVS